MSNTDIPADFALRTIGEQTLQLKMLNLVLEQTQKEIEDLKKTLGEHDKKKKPKKNDKKNPDAT